MIKQHLPQKATEHNKASHTQLKGKNPFAPRPFAQRPPNTFKSSNTSKPSSTIGGYSIANIDIFPKRSDNKNTNVNNEHINRKRSNANENVNGSGPVDPNKHSGYKNPSALAENEGVIQCSKWKGHSSDNVKTPIGALKDAFGYSPTEFDIPQNKYLQDTAERPHWVEAEVEGARNQGRPPSSVPSMVASIGNSELKILTGAQESYYEGGHLIGDAYLGDVDSMQEWNLAPQHNLFNAPTYYNEVEKIIEELPRDPLSGKTSSAVPVNVKAEVEYPDKDYVVTEKELKDRNVLPLYHPDPGGPGKSVTIPRRVPRFWKLQAWIDPTSAYELPKKTMTPSTISGNFIQNPLETVKAEPHGSFHIFSPSYKMGMGGKPVIEPGKNFSFQGHQYFPTNTPLAFSYQVGGTQAVIPPAKKSSRITPAIVKIGKYQTRKKYRQSRSTTLSKYYGKGLIKALEKTLSAQGTIPTRNALMLELFKRVPKNAKERARKNWRANVRDLVQDANIMF